MEMFSWFDLIALALIVILAFKGMMNGFIKEIFGLIGIIGGVFLATRYAEVFGEYISSNIINIQNESAIYLVGFIVILFLFWIASIFIGFLLSKIISFSALTFVDKVLGFVVGGLKVFLVLSVLIAALSYIDFVKVNFLDKGLKNSFMYEYFIKSGRFIVNLDYSSIDNTIDDFSNKIKDVNVENTNISNKTEDMIDAISNNLTNMNISAKIDEVKENITNIMSNSSETENVSTQDNVLTQENISRSNTNEQN